jgi:uncharacterized protein DUF6766
MGLQKSLAVAEDSGAEYRFSCMPEKRRLYAFFYDHSLAIVMFSLFAVFLLGQAFTGHVTVNEERRAHEQPSVSFRAYVASSEFLEAVFENWESEFLQMGAYVLFTIFLHLKGSPESKKLHVRETVDADPDARAPYAPWPVHRGGLIERFYRHSLSSVLLALFFFSFILHAVYGAQQYNKEQHTHGQEPVSVATYGRTPRFWFESLQNWQSEFLSVGLLLWLAVFLREKGSPVSKPVGALNEETGK